MDKTDLLWSLYESERDFLMHLEGQRTSACNILTAIAAGLVVAVGSDQLNQLVEIGASAFLVLVGLFGFFFSAKLTEELKLHARRSHRFLDELDGEFADVDIANLKAEVWAKHVKEFPLTHGIKLRDIWAVFHICFVIAGAVLLLQTVSDFETPVIEAIQTEETEPPPLEANETRDGPQTAPTAIGKTD